MLRKKSLIVVLLFVVAIQPLIAGSASAQMEPTYRAIVRGGPDGLERLKSFYAQLREYLGVTDLALADVGCDKCGELDSGPAEDVLVFYMPRKTLIVLAFTLSWLKVQEAGGNDQFTLQLDRVSPPDPLCPPVPQCKPRAACQITDFCDKPWGGTCDKC